MCFRKKYRYRYWKILQYLDGILILPQYFSTFSIDIAVHFRYRYSLLFFGIGKNTTNECCLLSLVHLFLSICTCPFVLVPIVSKKSTILWVKRELTNNIVIRDVGIFMNHLFHTIHFRFPFCHVDIFPVCCRTSMPVESK